MAELEFQVEGHKYLYNGQIIPSVTQLLNKYGLIDFSGIPIERLEYKRIVGEATDYACHLLNENNLDESSLSPAIVPYVTAFKKFCEITGFEPTLSKKRLYSKVWGFAGELDSLGSFSWKGRDYQRAVLDWKCVWEMYYSVGPQTAAYQILYEENYKEKCDGRFGIQLKPSGTFEVYKYDKPSDKNVFLSCVTIENARRENKLLKQEEI